MQNREFDKTLPAFWYGLCFFTTWKTAERLITYNSVFMDVTQLKGKSQALLKRATRSFFILIVLGSSCLLELA